MNPHAAFAYLTAPNAAVYRAVIDAFAAAKRQFVVHLRLEDVVARTGGLSIGVDGVSDALTQLAAWGNLRADPDHARVTTVEDFHRARYLYQLTSSGEAAQRAVQTFDEQLGRRGALQAVALADIEARLGDLARLGGETEPDEAQVARALRDLFQRATDLADNAQAFMGSLQSALDLHDIDVDAFVAYRDQLIDYLERFLADLLTLGAAIAEQFRAMERPMVDRLLKLAAEREARDQFDVRPAGEEDNPESATDQVLTELRERWGGLERWFVDDPSGPSQARLLRQRARSAIPQLLAVIARLNERREARSDRAADFTTLAHWFAEAPSDADRHRLWRVAFGLTSSRHLSVDPETLSERDERPVAPATPWASAPPMRISPRLRKTGSYERRGRPSRVIDRQDDRLRLRALTEQQAAQVNAAREQLLTDGPVLLSTIGQLSEDAFPLFLALLGDALSAQDPATGAAEVMTGDGSLTVTLVPLAEPAAATIVTPHGTFSGPDHLIEIRRATP